MKLPKIHFESKETKIPLAKGLGSPKLEKAANTRLRAAENIAQSHSLLLPRKYFRQTMEPQASLQFSCIKLMISRKFKREKHQRQYSINRSSEIAPGHVLPPQRAGDLPFQFSSATCSPIARQFTYE